MKYLGAEELAIPGCYRQHPRHANRVCSVVLMKRNLNLLWCRIRCKDWATDSISVGIRCDWRSRV